MHDNCVGNVLAICVVRGVADDCLIAVVVWRRACSQVQVIGIRGKNGCRWVGRHKGLRSLFEVMSKVHNDWVIE